MEPSYPAFIHRRILHHQQGMALLVQKFGEEAREPAIQNIREDGLVRLDGEIIEDWDDWDWVFFRGQKDIDEQAVILTELYGELFLNTVSKAR